MNLKLVSKKIKNSLILSLFLFLSIHSFAATLKGKVVDNSTGEPLVGATVKIKNTNLVALVKLDGTFVFKNTPKGKIELTVSFTGYKTADKAVQIDTDNDTKTVSFLLEATSNALSSVTVSSTNSGSDNATRRLEKMADPIINVLSAKTIQLLPDITVANALQRVSGVTIEKSGSGEARYPIIRGMEKRYINTLVNGIKIPSPDNKSRYIPLDIFPSELLERLEVSKSLTPSMEGDAIGGTVNLVMKDAPTKKVIQANYSSGYSNIFASQTFQQFDHNSINKLSPSEINGKTYVSTPKDFSVAHLNYTDKTSPINSTFGLTYGNRFGREKKLGFIASYSYQNIYRGTTSNFFLPNSQPGFDNIPLFSDLQKRQYSVQSQRTGLNAKLDYVINSKNKITLTNTYVKLNDYQTRIVYDTVTLNSLVDNWQRSSWNYQSIYNATLQGYHTLSNSLKADWSLVYSTASNNTPDQSEFKHQYQTIVTPGALDKVQGINHTWLHNTDKDVAGYLNFTKSTKLFNRAIDLKAGVLVRSKNRDNFYNHYSLNPLLNSLYTNINSAIFIYKNPADGAINATGNNYTFKEDINAEYIQAKWQLSSKLEAIGGVRIENTNQHYETELGPDVEAKSGTIKYTDKLPSLQLKYSLNQTQNLRIAYYQAIARPGFAELIPDGPDGEFFKEKGDPVNLKHTTSNNLDIRYELYPGNADQFLIGAFYKDITNPIEISAVKPRNINSLYLLPVNSPKATNYGLEVVLTKYFGSFGISANYTYTNSSITRDSMLLSYKNATGTAFLKYVSETRPLQGQSNHIGNVSLIYKNPTIGLDIQTALVYTGERVSFVSPYYGLHYWQSPTTQLDLSFEKRIVKKLSFYGKINNLTDAPLELSLHQSYNNYLAAAGRPIALQTNPDSQIIIQRDFYKTSYLFGLRYKF